MSNNEVERKLGWKSDKELEEERRKIEVEGNTKEEDIKKKEEARAKRIKESTDSSMDEMGKYYFEVPYEDGTPRTRIESINVSKRQAMLIEEEALSAHEIFFSQMEERRKIEVEKEKEKIRRIRECKTNEELETIVGHKISSNTERWLETSDGKGMYIRLTHKEIELLNKNALTQNEIDQICYERSPMSLWKIKQAISRVSEKGER